MKRFKEKMKLYNTKLKKLLFIICCFFVLILLCIFSVCLYSMRNNDRLYLKSIVGNIDVIKAINVSGTISDNITKTDFIINNGKLSKSFGVVANNTYTNNAYLKPGKIGVLEYTEPSADSTTTYIPTNDKTSSGTIKYTNKFDLYYTISQRNNGKSIAIKTQVIRNSLFNGSYSSSVVNGITIRESLPSGNYGYSDITNPPVRYYKDKIYVYTITGPDCSGTGGIYEISNLKRVPIGVKTQNDSNIVEAKYIAPVDLENGNIQINGLEVVGNKLALIIQKSGFFVIKIYDANNGKFIKDIETGLFQSTEYNQLITSSINDDYINIEISRQISVNPTNFVNSFITIDIKRLECVTSFNTNGSKQQTKTNMKYENNCLFIITQYFSSEQKPSSFLSYIETRKIDIYVYKDKNIIYYGEVVSDILKDIMTQGEQNKYDGRTYFRDFYNIRLS